MKNRYFLKQVLVAGFSAALALSGCKKDDGPKANQSEGTTDRWITVAGALFGTDPGDGNGGTMVYSVKREDAVNPEVSINVFDNGVHVKSSRTARLQASNDGSYLYNIQYTGADGGVFNKYKVEGGNILVEEGAAVSVADYAGTSPRWVKASEDIGVAVNVRDIKNKFASEDENAEFVGVAGTAVVVVLDLKNPSITNYAEFELALSAEEQKEGHHIFRLDAPVLNAAGNKLYIGTWTRKWKPGTTEADASAFQRLGTKTVVLDYPSLTNPKIITSTRATGDNSGYRSPMSFVGSDKYVYQATHRETAGTGGSKILRINPDGTYDNSYSISVDDALGVKDSYIESWRYAGDGIGYIIYSLNVGGERTGGYIARVDLNSQFVTKVNIPNEANMDFGQYQGIAVVGDEVFIAVAGVGVDGNIYVFNTKTAQVTVGAKLVNPAGNRYIGVY